MTQPLHARWAFLSHVHTFPDYTSICSSLHSDACLTTCNSPFMCAHQLCLCMCSFLNCLQCTIFLCTSSFSLQMQFPSSSKKANKLRTFSVWLQSRESGGHGASPASLVSFIPELVDCVNALCQKLNIQQEVPVAAAGGICDARQVCLLSLQPACHDSSA